MSSTNISMVRRVLNGDRDRRLRATWRILLLFVVFFGTLLASSRVLGLVAFPDVLINASTTLAVFISVAVLLYVGTRFVGKRSVADYGFALDRRWWLDAMGGTVLGFLFQGLVTALLFAFGSARVVDSLSPGLGDGPVTVAIAFGATVFALLAVAVWEELLFRGIVIQNALEGLSARGMDGRLAMGIALVSSTLVFGLPHVTAVADGASAGFAVFQAVVAGLYFGLAYLLTDSLAFPIGIHFSTNLWVASVFSQPDSAFPALLRIERTLAFDPEGVVIVLLPALILIGLIVGWVRFTRGELSIADSLLLPPASTSNTTTAE